MINIGNYLHYLKLMYEIVSTTEEEGDNNNKVLQRLSKLHISLPARNTKIDVLKFYYGTCLALIENLKCISMISFFGLKLRIRNVVYHNYLDLLVGQRFNFLTRVDVKDFNQNHSISVSSIMHVILGSCPSLIELNIETRGGMVDYLLEVGGAFLMQERRYPNLKTLTIKAPTIDINHIFNQFIRWLENSSTLHLTIT